jgi:hypothetical protein
VTVKIQVRRGTATQWNTSDPVLSQGEIGYETNTGKFKVGNGSDVWSDLNYFLDEVGVSDLISGASLTTTDDLNEGSVNKYFTVQRVNDALNSGTLQNISFTYADGAIDVSVPTVQGTTGTQGAQGLQGTQGTQGEVGPQGTQGLQGMQGLQGTQGPQGIQGTQGELGLTGSQGLQGETGVQGITGSTGAQGTTGIQGSAGYIGADGAQGTQGIQGIQGEIGSTGSQGTTGASGGSSSNWNYKFDTSTTDSAPGTGKLRFNNATQTSATYIYVDHINDLGVDIDAILALIKQYDNIIVQQKADSNVYITFEVTGAVTVVSNSYIKIPVNRVADGGAGSNSFSNTEAIELITFVTGLQGAQGTQGLQGSQGLQGEIGTQGTQGIQGYTGSQGTTGSTGAQGTTGDTGAQGTTGSTGTQGATGTQGIQGVQGPQGTQGDTGTQGTTGTNGTQGIQGITGQESANPTVTILLFGGM